MSSNRINSPGSNLYGCPDCPRCKSGYRAPYVRDGKIVIECDDCGFHEEAVNARPGERGHMEVDDDGQDPA